MRRPGCALGDASLLFALESRAGTLVPDADAGKGHFTLTLRGVERRATWFTDRPQRNAGRVNTRKLFRAWRELGFRASPPNAALVVDAAKSSRDTVAVELKLHSYNKRRRSVRFAVRTLGSLGGGLRHINRHLDRRLPRHFADASLFIDNAGYRSGYGCTLGQPQLMAYDGDAGSVQGMLPANGQLLSTRDYEALFSILGAQFGGNWVNTFALPDMTAPPNLGWFICVVGRYPITGDIGFCVPGEVDYWIFPEAITDPDWLPADGRTVSANQYPEYADGTGQALLQLPDFPAPQGMQSLVCMDNAALPLATLGQADLFPGPPADPAGSWLPAQGQALSASRYPGTPASPSCSIGTRPTGHPPLSSPRWRLP